MLNTKKNENSVKSRSAEKKIFAWLDGNILTVLTGILIVIIPAYPKIPLADVIPGYIVRLRFEDLLIAFTALVWLIQVARGKARFAWEWVGKLIMIYMAVGLASSLSAVFVTHTVTMDRDQLEKLALYLARHGEYFSLFFIGYSGIRTRRDLKTLVGVALATLVGVIIYGFGQKYYYWPAFSTMNREFSKGMLLYLTPESRVMSTFGGHYDYAAYLMMMLAFLVPGFWLVKKWLPRLGLIALALAAYWSLIMTASRTSWGGYITGITVLAVVIAAKYGRGWALRQWLAVMFFSMAIMLTVGDLSERFFQVIQSASALHELMPWVPTGELEADIFKVKDTLYTLQNLKSVLTKPQTAPPKNGIAMSDLDKVTVSSDTPPITSKPLPPDVTAEQDAERLRAATASATATGSAIVKKDNGYSQNALKYGLSVAIRLDAQWPRALAGFEKNPLLGSGYSTLSKATVDEFTDAESTDNDFLRMLGETGLLGTLAFLAIPGYLMYLGYTGYRRTDSVGSKILFLGALGAVVGLLVNATYIDVFESSKVAYTLSLIAAVLVRQAELARAKAKS